MSASNEGVRPALSGRRSMSRLEAVALLKSAAQDKMPTEYLKGLIAEAEKVLKTGEHWVGA